MKKQTSQLKRGELHDSNKCGFRCGGWAGAWMEDCVCGLRNRVDRVGVCWQMERLPEECVLGPILCCCNGCRLPHLDSCNNSTANISPSGNNKFWIMNIMNQRYKYFHTDLKSTFFKIRTSLEYLLFYFFPFTQ